MVFEDCIYHCCGGCRGLFSSSGDLSEHKKECTGQPVTASNCSLFACEKDQYLLLRDVKRKENINESIIQDKVIDKDRDKTMSSSRSDAANRSQSKKTATSGTASLNAGDQVRCSLRRSAVEKFRKMMVEMHKGRKQEVLHDQTPQQEQESQMDTSSATDENSTTPCRKKARLSSNSRRKIKSEQVMNRDDESNGSEASKMRGNLTDGDLDDVTLYENKNKVTMSESHQLSSANDHVYARNDSADLDVGLQADGGLLPTPPEHHSQTQTNSDTQKVTAEQVKSEIEADQHSTSTRKRKRGRKRKILFDVKSLNKQDSSDLTKNNIYELNKDILERHGIHIDSVEELSNIKLFKCSLCTFETKYIGMFVRHANSHNNTADGKFYCDICSAQFLFRRFYTYHLKTHGETFLCEICDYRCGTVTALQKHHREHTGEYQFKCKECDYSCKQKKCLIEHMRKHTGEKLRCSHEDCTFSTIYSWAYKSHLEKHQNKKRFMCSDCGYQTNDNGSLKRHMKRHTNLKAFKCSECSYRGITRGDIVKHMRRHTQEKVYFCDQCSYSSSQPSGIRLHKMQHLGIKPYHCTACGYASVMKAKVLRHIRQKHEEGSEELIGYTEPKVKILAKDFRTKGALTNPKDYNIVKLNADEIERLSKEDIESPTDEGRQTQDAGHVTLAEGREEVVMVQYMTVANEIQTTEDTIGAVPVEPSGGAVDVGGDDLTLYQCGMCGMVFDSAETVEIHSIATHWTNEQQIATHEQHIVLKEEAVYQ